MSEKKKQAQNGFIKETENKKGSLSRDEKDRMRDSGYRKAAEFLVLLGKDEAAKVLKYLSEEEIEGITREIALIKKIDSDKASKIFEEFGYLYKTKDLVARGGEEKAREILIKTFGDEKGSGLFEKILERTVPHPFSFLKDVEYEQVRMLLKNESAPVISVVLSHLDRELAAGILSSLKLEQQKEIAKRIAVMEKITPEVIRRTEEILREKLRNQGLVVTQDVDGRNALVEIIRHMNISEENNLIDEIEKKNPDLAENLRKDLFNMDIIPRIRDRDLQKVLREFGDKEIALILKGQSDEIKNTIFGSISSRRRDLIKLEYDAWGEVLRSEVDKAAGEFLEYIRRKAEEGKLLIMNDKEEYLE